MQRLRIYCLVNVFVATGLITPFVIAIALTVVVAVNVKAPSYSVLEAVGVLPSVV